MLLAALAALISSLTLGQFVPPDPRDCGKGITCFPCLSDVTSPSAFNCSDTTHIWNGCISDKKAKIGKTLDASSSAECCGHCSTNAKCNAWTFFGESNCNIFADSTAHASGATNCVSGSVNPPTPTPPVPAPGPPCTDCPNILLLFTDDQDLLIGGYDPNGKSKTMAQTQRVIAEGGLTMTHWAIHTPICAPSRAELMSGRYYHNVKNTAKSPPGKLCGSGAVGHVDLKNKVYPYTFANTLRVQKGYRTGLFGKCMNGGCKNPVEMNGAYDRWFEGTNFQGGTWYDNESPDNSFTPGAYGGGYGTSVIGNKTIDWISNITKETVKRPFFVYFAPHAPHSPATPSAWYKDACEGVVSPRIPNYNWSTRE